MAVRTITFILTTDNRENLRAIVKIFLNGGEQNKLDVNCSNYRPMKRKSMASSNTANPACACCRAHRKKCPPDCLLSPYFPASDPNKFEILHKIFGINRVIKMLKDVPVEQRADAVHSMVYEATARVTDRVHGCWSAVHQLKQQIAELKSQIAASEGEIEIKRLQRDNLVSIIFGRLNEGVGHDYNAIGHTSQPNEGLMLEDPLPLCGPFGDI